MVVVGPYSQEEFLTMKMLKNDSEAYKKLPGDYSIQVLRNTNCLKEFFSREAA
jgi:hypothetical protein